MTHSSENRIAHATRMRCIDKGCAASKKFIFGEDGKRQKKDYIAGTNFEFKIREFKDIYEFGELIKEIEKCPRDFLIRGMPTQETNGTVVRRLVENGGIFRDDPCHWLMADFDKIKDYPSFIDPIKDPEAGVAWVRGLMGTEFADVTCFYQYSSSQSVPEHLNQPPPQTLSMHLFFMLDRGVTSDEWRRYFKTTNQHVDWKLYNGVQPHFIAAPQFIGFKDPLGNKRSGFLE